jgi:hypothetical protein
MYVDFCETDGLAVISVVRGGEWQLPTRVKSGVNSDAVIASSCVGIGESTMHIIIISVLRTLPVKT